MNQSFKVSITREDLYSKNYSNRQKEARECKYVNEIKNGLIQVVLKIIQELN